MGVEKPSDELRVGAKDQSNPEIARTPRNAFRGSLVRCLREVELPIGSEGFAACQFQTNSECARTVTGSEGAGAKVRVREEKNPDHLLRPRSGG